VVIAFAGAALVLAGVILLIPVGLRTGDQPGDALLANVVPLVAPRGASVTISNRGGTPVLVGMSLRHAGPRLRLEGPSYVRIRNGRTTSELLAGSQTCIGVLDVGETASFVVPAAREIRRRAELVAVIGQPGRLRTVHRLVLLPQEEPPATRRHAAGAAARSVASKSVFEIGPTHGSVTPASR